MDSRYSSLSKHIYTNATANVRLYVDRGRFYVQRGTKEVCLKNLTGKYGVNINLMNAQNMLNVFNDVSKEMRLKINLSKTQYSMTNLILNENLFWFGRCPPPTST